MQKDETIIAHTRKWITDVVVGCNFCPFAAKELKKESLYYEVAYPENTKAVLESLLKAFNKLDDDNGIETMFLITPDSFTNFDDYLQLLELAENLLEKEGYEGIYQLASFHPEYLFAGSSNDDASNYTNRSPYPMLHILREESVSRAVDSYPDTENIPRKNIAFARQKGVAYMQSLKDASTKQ